MSEKERQRAMDINYKLGNYEEGYCLQCGYLIEDYEDSKRGLCGECQEEVDNY
jgi:hypothetical protein